MNLTITLDMAMTGNTRICPKSEPKIQKLTVENVTMIMFQSLMGLLKRNIVDPTFQDLSSAQGTQ